MTMVAALGTTVMKQKYKHNDRLDFHLPKLILIIS